jgi:hypothetical protein
MLNVKYLFRNRLRQNLAHVALKRPALVLVLQSVAVDEGENLRSLAVRPVRRRVGTNGHQCPT